MIVLLIQEWISKHTTSKGGSRGFLFPFTFSVTGKEIFPCFNNGWSREVASVCYQWPVYHIPISREWYTFPFQSTSDNRYWFSVRLILFLSKILPTLPFCWKRSSNRLTITKSYSLGITVKQSRLEGMRGIFKEWIMVASWTAVGKERLTVTRYSNVNFMPIPQLGHKSRAVRTTVSSLFSSVTSEGTCGKMHWCTVYVCLRVELWSQRWKV